MCEHLGVILQINTSPSKGRSVFFWAWEGACLELESV